MQIQLHNSEKLKALKLFLKSYSYCSHNGILDCLDDNDAYALFIISKQLTKHLEGNQNGRIQIK